MTFIEMAFFPANFMLQTHHENDHHQPPTSLSSFLPPSTPQDFHGVASVLLGKRSMSFSGIDNIVDQETNGDEDLSDDDGSQAGEKKIRRLNMEQVKTLEKNFELGNKLEPERKMQLARALGLQPRQIAIWFQNRRARWKTKNLEKDYEVLKRRFEAMKADNDALQAQNQKLQEQILALKSRESTEPINLNKDSTEGSSSNNSENSSEIKLNISRTPSAIDTDSHLSTQYPPTSRPGRLFPQSVKPTGVAQLFQNSSRPELQLGHIHHDQKIDQVVKEESFCNLFCGVDDQQTGFWPWLEQQQFN